MYNAFLRLKETLERLDEMSIAKNKAIDAMINSSNSMNNHLMKLIVFGWNTDWAKTIFDISDKICNISLKPNNKRLSKQQIRDNLFRSYCTSSKVFVSRVPIFIKNYSDEYGESVEQTDNEVAKKYEEIVDFLIDKIEKENGVLRSEIYDKIKRTIQ